MNPDQLEKLRIPPADKRRSRKFFWAILVVVVLMSGAAIFLALPKPGDESRIWGGGKSAGNGTPPLANTNALPAQKKDTALTVSGYIINRERIEISPRFMGVVKWIGVKKGDPVTNGQVVVLLDDAEQRARMAEAAGHLTNAQVAVAKARLDFERVMSLASSLIESEQAQDEARLRLDSSRASLQEAEGTFALARTFLEWTVIHSPIDGVVVEKLVDPAELVVPQSFGGTRGPSTALIAVADPKDLQVEVDLNESDLPKVFLNQPCRISPEAYTGKIYQGFVAEIAPEANRQKGTLQIKVQIRHPDRFLTPELSAKVDFLITTNPAVSVK